MTLGQILFLQGEHADRFYVVRKGRISLQMPAIMGPTLEIQSVDEGQIRLCRKVFRNQGQYTVFSN